MLRSAAMGEVMAICSNTSLLGGGASRFDKVPFWATFACSLIILLGEGCGGVGEVGPPCMALIRECLSSESLRASWRACLEIFTARTFC